MKTQESSGLERDAILPIRMTDCQPTQAPEGAAGDPKETRRNIERGSPGDEPGRVRWQGKALKGGTPRAAAA
jgi:hypothetical protein